MVDKLLLQGITVERSSAGFTHEGRVYGPGTWVVSVAQPKRGVVRWLLGRTLYPDNSYTRTADGDPIRPYDMSGDVPGGVHGSAGGRGADGGGDGARGGCREEAAPGHGRLLRAPRLPDGRRAERRVQGGEPAVRRGRRRCAA